MGYTVWGKAFFNQGTSNKLERSLISWRRRLLSTRHCKWFLRKVLRTQYIKNGTTDYKTGSYVGNTNKIGNINHIRNNLLAITFQLELTSLICMIRANVEFLSIVAWTGARRGIGFYTLWGEMKGPMAIGTKNVTRKKNTRTLLDGVSLMAGNFGFLAQHCFTFILPKYDESVLFVNIIENCSRGFSFFLHLHILTQSSFQERSWLKQEVNCSHQELQQILSIDVGVSLPHFILCQYWSVSWTCCWQPGGFSSKGPSVSLGREQCPSALDT